MRRILLVFLFASLALPACTQQSSPKTAPLKTVAMETQVVEKLLEKRLTPNFVPGEVVVKMKPAAALRIMPSTELKRLNLEVKREQTSGSEIVYRLPPVSF
jgi:serine protease